MAFVVVADRAPHDGYVWLGLRVVVGRQRVLYPYVEPAAEHPPQAVGCEVYADRVADSLRCHGVQVSVDEFQLGVRLERAGFYGTVVFDPAQAVVADGDVGRCGSHDGGSIVARKPASCGPAWIRPHFQPEVCCEISTRDGPPGPRRGRVALRRLGSGSLPSCSKHSEPRPAIREVDPARNRAVRRPVRDVARSTGRRSR